jgi:hypothetical protein
MDPFKIKLTSTPIIILIFGLVNGTWNGKKGEGKKGVGVNSIEKITEGNALTENFKILKGSSEGFTGRSFSAYNSIEDTWKQIWSDSQGGFYDFFFSFENDQRIFRTKLIKDKIILRMVFKNIEVSR